MAVPLSVKQLSGGKERGAQDFEDSQKEFFLITSEILSLLYRLFGSSPGNESNAPIKLQGFILLP